MPVVAEAVGPWLGVAVGVGALNLAIVVHGLDGSLEQAVLLLALAAAVTAAGLVAARSSQVVAARDREERSRPAPDELDGPGAPVAVDAYLDGMAAWAERTQELLEHAVGAVGPGDPRRATLERSAEDAAALLELLRSVRGGALRLPDLASLRSVGALWEADQAHVESVAASVDPAWHRRWAARSVVERGLRHGQVDHHDLVLPYRT